MSDLNTWLATPEAARRLGVNPQSLNGRLRLLSDEVGSITSFGINGHKVEARRGAEGSMWRILSEPTILDSNPKIVAHAIFQDQAPAVNAPSEESGQLDRPEIDPWVEPWFNVQKEEPQERIEPKKGEPTPVVLGMPIACGGIHAEIVRAIDGFLVKFSMPGAMSWLVPFSAMKDLSALSSWIIEREKQINALLEL